MGDNQDKRNVFVRFQFRPSEKRKAQKWQKRCQSNQRPVCNNLQQSVVNVGESEIDSQMPDWSDGGMTPRSAVVAAVHEALSLVAVTGIGITFITFITARSKVSPAYGSCMWLYRRWSRSVPF